MKIKYEFKAFVTVSDDQYAVFNGPGYAVLIFFNEYVVLDRKLDTPYPMEMDTPSGKQVDRRIERLFDTTIGGFFTLKNSRPLPDFEEYAVSTLADTPYMILWSTIKKSTFTANTPYPKPQYSVSEDPILRIGQYSVFEDPILRTVFWFPPYPFNYPTRRLTIEKMLAKFIDKGKREHEEMEIFIKEFRTTNVLLLKERSNLLIELEIKNLKQLDINIPFIEALVQIPKYAKYLKSLLTNKSRLEEACTETMNERCSTVLLNELPSKEKDPMSFTTPCQVLEKHKEAEDLAADHLSRFENPHMEVLTKREIADKFSKENLMVLKSKFNNDEPWYADFVNYIVGKEPYAFKLCADNIMRRCVAGSETVDPNE
ncbi:hypothetical protein Tco_1329934 [Tanacetum coccineum]